MFNKNTSIRNRVMAVIDKKILDAQKTLDSECKSADKKLESDIAKLRQQNVLHKEQVAEKLVADIVGKFI